MLCNEPKSETETEEQQLNLTIDQESDTEEDVFLKLGEKTDVYMIDDRPRFSPPVWLSEIEDNKVFNKQKNMNNNPAEVMKQAPTVHDNTDTPNRPGRPFPVRSISEIIDDDFELNSQVETENETMHSEIKEDDAKKPLTPETDL